MVGANIKVRLQREIDRLVDAGYSEKCIFRDALNTIEALEEMLSSGATEVEPTNQSRAAAKKLSQRDIVDQLRAMGFASTLAIPDSDFPMHPKQVSARAIAEVEMLRTEIETLKNAIRRKIDHECQN